MLFVRKRGKKGINGKFFVTFTLISLFLPYEAFSLNCIKIVCAIVYINNNEEKTIKILLFHVAKARCIK